MTNRLANMESTGKKRTLSKALILTLLVIYALGSYWYLTMRFGGNWIEGDTSRVTASLLSASQANSLVAPGAYPSGVTYTAVSLFIHELGGISYQELQRYVYALILGFTPVIIFVSYRALTGNSVVALLSVLFCYLQPDFLWVTWRGSHERLTWLLVFVSLYGLASGFFHRIKTVGVAGRYMVVFYLAVFALISTNVFFASSYVIALSIGLVSWYILTYFVNRGLIEHVIPATQLRRLVLVVLSSLVLLYLFFFHIYPPAQSGLQVLDALVEQVAVLVLGIENTAQTIGYDPYAYIGSSWSSTNVYILLTTFNWFVLLVSVFAWTHWVLRAVIKKDTKILERPNQLVMLVYPAFAVQILLSLILDRSSLLGGNFQVRLFTPTMLMAIPIAAQSLLSTLDWLRHRKKQFIAFALAVGAIGWFSIVALVKAANEPILNNNWMFTTTAEDAAGDWMVRNAKEATVWAAVDERMDVSMSFRYQGSLASLSDIKFDGFSVDAGTQYFLISEIETVRMARRGLPLSYYGSDDLIYENGETAVYHRRPLTPYQR